MTWPHDYIFRIKRPTLKCLSKWSFFLLNLTVKKMGNNSSALLTFRLNLFLTNVSFGFAFMFTQVYARVLYFVLFFFLMTLCTYIIVNSNSTTFCFIFFNYWNNSIKRKRNNLNKSCQNRNNSLLLIAKNSFIQFPSDIS